jgi:hypothetical protein
MHGLRGRLRSGRILTGSLIAALCVAGPVGYVGSTAAYADSVVASMDITPTQVSAATCSTVTFVVETDDAFGNGVAGETITFSVTGANSASGTATTDTNGNASFSYSGTNAGTDTITATDQAAGLTVTATATWTGGGCGVPSCQISITSNFNGTAILGGSYIWFNSVFKPKGIPSSGATIQLTGATVSFTANGTPYTVAIPDAAITFSPSAAKATLSFNGSEWVETVPVSFADNVFLSGVPFLVPVGGLPGGISPVTWQGSMTLPPGVSLQWQWSAAVYSQFSTDLNALGVKPLHSTSLDAYPNGDQAGTPENFKPFVIGGARGGGGSNFTGSYSATGTCS